MPKLQENFTTVAIVCHRYERLAVLQNILIKKKRRWKRFEETVYNCDTEKKEAETKRIVWDLKNA